jgi:hypothetical protein
MLGIGDCFHDSPRLLLALQLIATIRGPILNWTCASSNRHCANSLNSVRFIEYTKQVGWKKNGPDALDLLT